MTDPLSLSGLAAAIDHIADECDNGQDADTNWLRDIAKRLRWIDYPTTAGGCPTTAGGCPTTAGGDICPGCLP